MIRSSKDIQGTNTQDGLSEFTVREERMATEKLSPGMQQYLDIKKDYQDAFLLFRMGDFYELFY